MVGVTKKAGLILAVIFGFFGFFVECSGSEKPPIDIEVTFRNHLLLDRHHFKC